MSFDNGASAGPARLPQRAGAGGPHLDVLLVEDSPTDALLTEEAFAASLACPHIHRVPDGEAALAFLRRQAPYRERPRPALVLLDLNLPRKSGLEVLREMKSDPALRAIPVVVLTTSRDEQDVAAAYDRLASCYVSKPLDFGAFGDVIRAIDEFWFRITLLPSPR